MGMPETSADEGALFCPHCDYDLRHSELRCPECGHPFDRQALLVSQIPWVHRRQVGWIRAWLQTARLVIFTASGPSRDIARPVSWASAASFSRATLAVASLLAGAGWAAIFPTVNPKLYTMRFNYDPLASRMTPHPFLFPIYVLPSDFMVALVVALSTFLGGMAVQWWVRAWFWMRASQVRERASALSLYLAAWWLPAVLLAVVEGTGFAIGKHVTLPASFLSAGMLFLAAASPLLLIIAWLASVLRHFHKLTGRGSGEICVAAVVVPLGSVILFAMFSTVTAYLAGLAELLIRSLW